MPMISSEERQEVAKALRGDPAVTLIEQTRDGFEGMTYHEAAYRFWDLCRRVRSVAKVDIARSTCSVLADLIDPTCEVVGTTSEEGLYGPTIYHHELSCGHTCDTGWPEPPKYCDECGRRVTNGD